MNFFNNQSKNSKIDYDIPWIEKYRPNVVNDLVGQESIISSLRESLLNGNFPNLLFYGPTGVGKTSSIIAVSKELFKDQYNNRVMELNASKERGIKIIRHKIKTFAKSSVNKYYSEKGIPEFKIIILDEADNITKDAQNALRRSMEMYSNTTRFCIICNYISKIIDPITSRCSMYKFDKLGRKPFRSKLEFICKKENVVYENKILSKIFNYSGGDLRKGISLLDYAAVISDNNIKYEDISFIIGEFQISNFEMIFDKKLNEEKICQFTYEIIKKGYCCRKIITLFLKELINSKKVLEEEKIKIMEEIYFSENHIIKGSSQYLSLLNIFINFVKKKK